MHITPTAPMILVDTATRSPAPRQGPVLEAMPDMEMPSMRTAFNANRVKILRSGVATGVYAGLVETGLHDVPLIGSMVKDGLIAIDVSTETARLTMQADKIKKVTAETWNIARGSAETIERLDRTWSRFEMCVARGMCALRGELPSAKNAKAYLVERDRQADRAVGREEIVGEAIVEVARRLIKDEAMIAHQSGVIHSLAADVAVLKREDMTRKIARRIYDQRCTDGVAGDDRSDWFEAERRLAAAGES